MAQNILTKNNARSTLLAGITSSATSLSVQAGHGARFSAPVTGEIAKLTLYDTAGNIEICHGITRSGDGWSTIVRAQEGTTARAWNAGDGISENATAGFLEGLSQLDRGETATAKKTFSAGAKFNVATEFDNGIGPGYINNVGISASVASGALTVALNTRALADPSPESPVEVAFRNRVAITGNYSILSITTPKSIVVPSGATLGFKPVLNTVTMTIAVNSVVTDTNHGRLTNDTVIFTTTGALPTGLTAGTVYYIYVLTPDTYNVTATPGGDAIDTSGTQSGTHTASYAEKGSIYVYLCYNTTTLELGVSKKAIFDESIGAHSATPITAGADSDNVLFTTTAPDQFAIRLIGRIDITTGAVAGEWNNAPTRIALQVKSSDVIAEFTTSSSPPVIPAGSSPINVEVGDLVTMTYRTNGAGNGTEYVEINSINILSGTAVLEKTLGGNPNSLNFMFIWPAILTSGVSFEREQTVVKRVIRAGTISTFQRVQSTFGTAPTNRSDHITTVITRPKR